MKALVVTNTKKLELKEIEMPTVSDNKVLVKVAYCGICGSDLPRYFDGGVHSFPQILGHEFSGTVEKVGNGVTSISAGDRVAVAPLIPCEKCEFCRQNNPAMCVDYSFVGSRENGGMAEYVAVPYQNCVKVPDDLSLKEAALLEPLTVAIHGVDKASLKTDENVLVFGSGTIGLLTILTLKAKGVGKIIAVDINDNKLELAKECGADVVINPNEVDLDIYFEENEKPQVIYETAGSDITQIQSLNYINKTGTVVYIGTGSNNVVLTPKDFDKILRGELDVTGSWMSYSSPFPGYEWTAGLHLMEKGKIDVSPLITGTYSLDDRELPFNDMIVENSKDVKLLYKIDEGV